MKNTNTKNILINGLTFIAWLISYGLVITIIKTGIENNTDTMNKIITFLEDTQAGDHPEIAFILCLCSFVAIGILNIAVSGTIYKAIHSKISAITEHVINLLNKPNKQEKIQRGVK